MSKTQEHGLSYLVIGVGLGLLAGLFWAPRAGKEIREELRRGADHGLNYLNKETEKIRAGAGHWLAKIREHFGADKAPPQGDIFEQASRRE